MSVGSWVGAKVTDSSIRGGVGGVVGILVGFGVGALVGNGGGSSPTPTAYHAL